MMRPSRSWRAVRSLVFLMFGWLWLGLGGDALSANPKNSPRESVNIVAPGEQKHHLIAYSTTRSGSQLQRSLEHLVHHLNVSIPGHVFEVRMFDDDAMMQAVKKNDVDFLLTGASQYVHIREVFGLVSVLGSLQFSIEGNPVNAAGGVIVVPGVGPGAGTGSTPGQGSPLRELSDLRGKRIAAVSPTGIGSYVAPALALLNAGVTMDEVAPLFLGTSETAVIEAVMAGRADAGFIGLGTLEQLKAEKLLAPDAVRVLAPRKLPGFPLALSTPLLPAPAFISMPSVPSALERQVARALLDFHYTDAAKWGVPVTTRFGVPVDYEVVATAMRRLKLPPFHLAQTMSWRDIWTNYRAFIISLMAALALVVLLALQLWLKNRALRQRYVEEQRLSVDLAFQKRQLQVLVNNLPQMIGLKDSAGRYIYVNKLYEKSLGRSLDQIIGRRDQELIDADTFGLVHHYDAEVMSTGQTLRRELWLTHPINHQRFHCVVTKVPVHDDAGQVVGILGILEDTTAARLQQDTLEATHRRMESVLAAMPDLMFEFDSAGVYWAVWARDTQLLAKQRESLLGRNVMAVLPLSAARVVMDAIQAAARFGISRGQRIMLELPDGLHWFELATSRMEGEEMRFLMLSRDVTDRIRLQEDLHTIMDNAGDGIWTATADGRYQYANPVALEMTGHTLGELRQMSMTDLVSVADKPQVQAHLEHIRSSAAIDTSEWNLQCKDGHQIDVELTTKGLPDGRLLAIGRDISQRKAVAKAMQRAAGVFSASIDGIVITNSDAVILDVNAAFSVITGYSREEVLGQRTAMLSSGRHNPEFFSAMWRSLQEQGNWRGEIWNRRKTGEVYAELLSVSSVLDAEGKVVEFVGIFSDISRIKRHEEELDRIAHYDVLTGLPNRRLFDDRLRQARARADRENTRLAVCFLDLDAFKPVNDEYGHAAGDELLRLLSERLQAALRGGETIARIGGDEFIILLTDLLSPDECLPALQRLLDIVSESVTIHGHEVSVSGSIGFTVYPDDDADSDTLMRHADQAMYAAKEQGKNRVHAFDAEGDKRVSAHREALAELDEAFVNEQFVLWYQPKIDLRTGAIVGAEALIRWQKPDGRIVPPNDFLPLLASSPLELRLSAWVIETALADTAHLHALGLPIQVSANLVATHLQQRDFADWLQALLERYPTLGKGAFSLEILESAAIGDVTSMADRLRDVQQLGIALALDDFGTGYSSLAYFRSLPINTLKIDQGFVKDMMRDTEASSIVESVVRLAGAFHRNVIAEGVETVEHWQALLAIGCDQGQGYGIARPMPLADFERWAREWPERGVWKQVVTP